jgi:Co/Zn/Cd efflux system component
MTPRKAAVVGIVFIVIAVTYWAFPTVVDPAHVDYAGITMLAALGVAMSLMAYVLFAGIPKR